MNEQRNWERRMRDRAVEIDELIASKLGKTPGSFAMLVLFQRTRVYRATQNQDPQKRARAMANPELAQLARLISKPSLASIRKLEQACDRSYEVIPPWWDGPSGVADLIAKIVGVKVAPAPEAPPPVPTTKEKRRP